MADIDLKTVRAFNVPVFRSPGREMKKPCQGCPFVREAEGRPYLTPERMESIKIALALGQPFYCHKSVYSSRVEHDEDGEPPEWDHEYKLCRGAIDFTESLKETDE